IPLDRIQSRRPSIRKVSRYVKQFAAWLPPPYLVDGRESSPRRPHVNTKYRAPRAGSVPVRWHLRGFFAIQGRKEGGFHMTGYAWQSFITRLLDVGVNAAQGQIG